MQVTLSAQFVEVSLEPGEWDNRSKPEREFLYRESSSFDVDGCVYTMHFSYASWAKVRPFFPELNTNPVLGVSQL